LHAGDVTVGEGYTVTVAPEGDEPRAEEAADVGLLLELEVVPTAAEEVGVLGGGGVCHG
jgi:hypothetical protein